MIRQLSEENNELKLALAALKDCSPPDSAAGSAPSASASKPPPPATQGGGESSNSEVDSPSSSPIPLMLKQRINELMVANADLEKEVARLR